MNQLNPALKKELKATTKNITNKGVFRRLLKEARDTCK
jgi:hypothetical protein